MGDNVFTKNDKAEKPDQASAAYLEAQKRLAETHISLPGASTLNLGASTEQPSFKAQIALADAKQSAASKASPPGEAVVVPNNNPLHLTSLAITGLAKGAWEPLAGGIQLTEQVANAATLNLPGVHKAFFSPEKLTPTQTTPEYVKYSPEWFISTAAESAGKLPWYYIAGKAMSKVPGFGEGAGALSESSLLGMNVKTAAASGFIVGALNPTAVQKDGSLTASLEDRGIQGTIGAGQMAIMTATTAYLGKGVAAGEKALLGKESAATEQTLVGLTQKTFLKTSTQATLQFLKRGTIASVGSIPAGLAAGYANAKITGSKFDAQENMVATATIGFGLGGINFGKAEAPQARTVDAPQVHTADAPLTRTADAPTATESLIKAPTSLRETATPAETSGSPLTARARARMTELAEKARAALVGGTLKTDFAFGSNDGVPDDAPVNKGETGGDKPADKATHTDETATPKEKTFEATLKTPEEFAKYKDVFDSLMKASKKDGTAADEEDFVKAAAKDPWTIQQLREHLAQQDIKSDHVNGLLDRADKAVKDNAMAAEKVPPYARASFEQGFDLLRNIADAREPKQLDDGIKALRSFVTDSDAVLASKDQLRNAAEKLGGPELRKEFDKAFDRRYPIAEVHQLPTDQAGRPPNKGEFTVVRSTQAEQFRSIVNQARAAVEGRALEAAPTTGEGTAETQGSPEHHYVKLRQMTENLDPDLKASLINYASKTNDVRFRALINDTLADPKGEDLPNRPIRLTYDPKLEPVWDKIENRLSAHPKPDVAGQAPSAEAVAKYRDTVFAALNHYGKSSPKVLELVQQYALQTNNSFEASALDYYFGSERLNAFPGVRQAKIEANNAAESRNSFFPKESAPEPVNLETGLMNDAYLERVTDRLGDRTAPKVRQFNNQPPLETLLNEAPKKFTDHGVTRGKYEGRPDGLVKVTSSPDNHTKIIGGRHIRAEFENNPDGIIQADDFADGTRAVREKSGNHPETVTINYSNGTDYTYASPDVWSIDFPNGNYVISYPENGSNVAREIKENGKLTQVLRDGTSRVVEDAASTEEPQEHIQNSSQITVDTLLEQMKSAQAEKGRIAAADALKSQIGAMDDSQFKSWLDFIRETPNEANARPAYMKMSGLRGMHALFESGILDDPATQKAFKSYLEVPEPGQFKLTYPRSMQGLTVDQLTPALSNDVRARFSTQAADGTTVYDPNLPAELQREFATTKPHTIKDKWDNEAPGLAADNLATRLNALPDLGSFQPKTASRLLELGAQDPRALADVMKLIKEPRNDIPAMKSLLAETIPNADDIYTVKLMLDSIDAARKAYKSPEIKEANRNLALTALADLTGDVAQDIKLGGKIDEIIKAPGGGKGAPDTSRMAASLELLPRTKADPNAAPAEVQPDPAATKTGDTGSGQPETGTGQPEAGAGQPGVGAGNPEAAAGKPEQVPVETGTTPESVPPAQTDAPQPGSGGDTNLAKDATEEVPSAPLEPVKPTVESLVDKMNSTEPDRVRLAAADSLKGQLSSLNDAQFHQWLEFVRQNSQEAPVRPNYMKMSGMRGLADVLASNVLDDPAAANALRDYLTPPQPGEFKLAYPNVLKGMSVDDMSPALLNDIRDRFSTKGSDGLIFQADVPPEMQDYLNTHERLNVRDNKGRRLPDLQPDTLDSRITTSSQLANFQPETAARLLELGAQDPRALADVIRLMKEPRNDNATMRNLLSETIPNADDIYTLKLFLDSIDAARWAFSPDRAQERAANTNIALNALSELTGDTSQDIRLGKDVQSIIKMKGYIPNPKPSRLADNLHLAERSKLDANAVPPINAQPPQALAASAPPPAEASVEPERQLTPAELDEISDLLRQRIAQQASETEATHEAVPPATLEPTTAPIEPAQIVSSEATEIAQPVQAPRPETAAPETGTSSGNSQLDKFARRQSATQRAQTQARPDAARQSGTKDAAGGGSKSGKPKQVYRSLADWQNNNLNPAADADDTGVGSKSQNADRFDRKEQSRKRDQQRQDRKFGDDDDN
jgi:hypothetical protein